MAIRQRSDYTQLLQFWNEEGPVPRFAQRIDGTIVWANSEFQKLIGYSSAELAHMNALALTDAGHVEHEREMIESVSRNDRSHYTLIKQMKPNGRAYVQVRVHAHRWPTSGELDLLLITCWPLINGQLLAYEQSIGIVEALRTDVAQFRLEMRSQADRIISYIGGDEREAEAMEYARPLIRFYLRHPRVCYFAALAVFLLSAGVPALDVIQRVMGLNVQAVQQE